MRIVNTTVRANAREREAPVARARASERRERRERVRVASPSTNQPNFPKRLAHDPIPFLAGGGGGGGGGAASPGGSPNTSMYGAYTGLDADSAINSAHVTPMHTRARRVPRACSSSRCSRACEDIFPSPRRSLSLFALALVDAPFERSSASSCSYGPTSPCAGARRRAPMHQADMSGADATDASRPRGGVAAMLARASALFATRDARDARGVVRRARARASGANRTRGRAVEAVEFMGEMLTSDDFVRSCAPWGSLCVSFGTKYIPVGLPSIVGSFVLLAPLAFAVREVRAKDKEIFALRERLGLDDDEDA